MQDEEQVWLNLGEEEVLQVAELKQVQEGVLDRAGESTKAKVQRAAMPVD